MDKRLVMVAIDGSAHSEHAFNYYCENLHRPENDLLLIHAGELPVISSGYPMYSSGDLWQQLLEKEKERVRALEEGFAVKMREKGLKGKIKAVFASKPGEVIVHEANESKVAMVVMGTRGLGSIRRTILGSVSDYVVHHAHCPVVVCRQ